MILARLLGLLGFLYLIFIEKNPVLYNLHLQYEPKCHAIQKNIQDTAGILIEHPLYIVLLACVAAAIYIIGTVIDNSMKLTTIGIVSLLIYLFLY